MLTGVTITGADDGVDLESLHALSAEFPFVEWGILHSKRRGRPRYPSLEWLQNLGMWNLGKSTAGARPLKFAAHFCGDYTRDVLEGRADCLDVRIFKRFQINGFKLPAPSFIEMARRVADVEFILQVRSEADIQPHVDVVRALPDGRASLLFDPSGGRGIETFRWPTKPFGVSMGYAGGIRPSTVTDVLSEIGPMNGDFWIDMESGVRVDDRFDLALVREVLERTAPFVSESSIK